MNIPRKFSFLALLTLLATAGGLGCGNDGNNNFTIFPSTATVERGGTFQFDTNPSGLLNVNWSVVGGAANGTIDATGLYTAPTTLPVENVVTVEAENDGNTESATVTLVAADTLSFSAPAAMNDTPVPGLAAALVIFFQGVGDGIGAQSSSVHVSGGWVGTPSGGSDVLYSQATDLAPFIPEVNLTNTNTAVFNSLILDENLNPGIFYSDSGTGILSFLGSTNQGASFGSPVPVVSPASGVTETVANAAIDGDNNYYLTYTNDFGGTPQVRFSTSTNQGASWSSTVPVTPSANETAFSHIAVSPDGDTVVVCYIEDVAGNSEVFASISSDGGANFATQVNISQSPADTNLFCRVALGPNGEIYVAFAEEVAGDSDILFASSTNGGSSFSSPITVNTVTTGAQNIPYMSVDSLGRIDMVWSDDSGASDQLSYARSLNGGTSFDNDVIVPPSAATSVIPRGLVHDGADRMHLQYFSDVNDPGNNVDFFYLNGE